MEERGVRISLSKMQEMDPENENTQVQNMNLPPGPTSCLWVLLNSLSFSGSLFIVIEMFSGWVFDNYKINNKMLESIAVPIIAFHMAYVYFLHHRRRGMPCRLVGGRRIALIELLILGCTIILRTYYPFDGSDFRNIGLLVLITFQLHSWGQSLHLSWDINVIDVVMHAVLEFGIYMTGYWTCIILTTIASVVILFRWVEYTVPITPEAIKKETA